ncbi:MAG: S9 family peptidase [Candidatus Limnocylindrales bacterium]
MAAFRSPIVPEDLAVLAVVNEAQISPDGSRVAYPVRRMDLAADRYQAAICVVATGGSGDPVAVTAGDDDAGAPRWSPDGLTIAYLSAGMPSSDPAAPKPTKQVHLVGATGGTGRRLTELPGDCADPCWAPDGSGLVVVVKDGAADDRPAARIRVYDRLGYQSDEAGLLDLRRRHLWWIPLAGAPQRLTDGDWNDSQPSFSPDGREIAFVSNRTGRRDRNTVADLWVVGRAAGATRRITDEHGTYADPSWSPDGRWLTASGVARARGAQVANQRIWRFPAAGGEGLDLLGSWDRTVGAVINSDLRGHAPSLPPTWSADGTRVYFIGSDQGSANLYSCASTGGGVRAVTLGAQHLVSASVAAGADRFAAVVATAVVPADVVAGSLDAAELRQLTRLNEPFLKTHFVAVPERLEFTGADGWTIEGWLLKPQGFDPAAKWPLVLEIHGGPHSAYGHSYFHEFQVLASRGYAVLYTNPRGSHAYGERFVEACIGDWGGKDHEDLMAGLDHILALGWVDPSRLYVTGGSYGGFMTNWIVGHTDRFKAAVTQRSISNNISAFGTSDIGWHFWEDEMGDATPWRDAHKLVERSPLTHVTGIHTPLLILHAENDRRCPIEQAEQLFVALQVLGREATFVRYPTDTHELTRSGKPTNRIDHCRRIVDWFDAHP